MKSEKLVAAEIRIEKALRKSILMSNIGECTLRRKLPKAVDKPVKCRMIKDSVYFKQTSDFNVYRMVYVSDHDGKPYTRFVRDGSTHQPLLKLFRNNTRYFYYEQSY